MRRFKITEEQFDAIRSAMLAEDSTDGTKKALRLTGTTATVGDASEMKKGYQILKNNPDMTMTIKGDKAASQKPSVSPTGVVSEEYVTTKRQIKRRLKENSIVIKAKDLL